MTFEEYLKEIHAKNYHGTDDNMPDSFEAFIVDLQIDEVIEYADEWHAQEVELERSKAGSKGGKSRMNKSTPEQRKLWASMGGKARKKKIDETKEINIEN